MDLDVVAARRLLGVQEGASEAQVRAAYRVMLKVWHPDCVRRKLSPRDPRAAVEPLRTDPVLAGFSDEALVGIAEIVAADREEKALDEALARTQEIIGAARTLRKAPAPSRSTRRPLVYQPESHVTGPRPLTSQAFMLSDGLRPIVAHNGSFEVISYAAGGATQLVVRVEGAWPMMTAREIRSKLDAQLIEASEDGQVDPRTRRVYEVLTPERAPEFSNLLISGDHEIWVASYEFDRPNGSEWLVFSSAGDLLGSVRTPAGLRLLEVREEFVVGVVLDDFDVPYLRRYPLVRRRERTVN